MPTYVTSFAGPISRDRDPADGGVADPKTVQRVGVKVVLSGAATGDGAQLGLFPGEPDSISSDGAAQGLTVGGADNLLTVDQYSIYHSTNTFTATGMTSTASAEQLRDAGTRYLLFVRDAYLDLNPSTASDRAQIAKLKQIADQWTVGQSNPYDEASAIESHLRDTTVFTYTLKPPKTKAGDWPIVDFLTTTRVGYCQYFASAMGALLRAEGIPARLVSGYGPGTIDDSRTRPGNALYTVISSDAHVWVEAYFPKYGWVAFEPTPDGTYSPISRGASASPSNPAATPVPSNNAQPTPRPTSTPRPDQNGGATGPTVPTIPPALLAVVGTLLLLVALFFALRSWIAHPRSLPAMWRRVGALGAVLGVRRRPSETYAGYVRRLSRALPPDTTTLAHRDGSAEVGPRPVRARTVAALELLADASGKAEFSASGLNEREVVQWRRAWDRVWRAVPLLLWRSVLARGARRQQDFG